MKKIYYLFGIAILVAGVALVLSILQISSCEVTNETYFNGMVTLLGLLIAFVVGFQIYSTIDIKETIKEYRKLEEELKNSKVEFDKKIAETKEEFDKNLVEAKAELNEIQYKFRGENQMIQGANMSSDGEYELSMYHFVKALDCFLRCKNKEYVNMAIRNSIAALSEWGKIPPKNPFKTPYSIEGKDTNGQTLEEMSKIIHDFGTTELYKEIEPRFLEIKTRLEQKKPYTKTRNDLIR